MVTGNKLTLHEPREDRRSWPEFSVGGDPAWKKIRPVVIVEAMGGDFVIYQFSRSKVERGDFAHFVGLFAPDQLPNGRSLREKMGSMMFILEGYDHDEREIHSIPEVRKFYRAFHDAWPYWLYFCTLEEDAMKMMILCCLDSFTMIKVDGNPQCQVHYDPAELLTFLRRDFPHMNKLCERAQMFEDRIAKRTSEILRYFGLPAPF